MAKTSKQIQGDVYELLRNSPLSSKISGDVYRNGMRPRDSRKEDAVVIFTTGLPDQIETGVVTVNIYVPDVDLRNDGVQVEDGQRTEQVEIIANDWVNSLTADKTCYLFSLQQTIYTEAEHDTHQHFIVVKLKYKYFSDEQSLKTKSKRNIKK